MIMKITIKLKIYITYFSVYFVIIVNETNLLLSPIHRIMQKSTSHICLSSFSGKIMKLIIKVLLTFS
jgi:hypothetical protein